ncbi:MAG: hypothetical protein B7Y12_12780 [Rhizobiales bacterium 24-66-13]|jgi:hypothetical protein|nr:MAG: hypothetical protein B7Y12_12780 [Rhizobiales bacterium 24-66-13]
MKRRDWWEQLDAVLTRYQSATFIRGQSDCLTLCLDAVESMTERDLFRDQRGYRSKTAAIKRGRALGFSSMGDGFASEMEEIHPVKAGRGDIAIIRDGKEDAGGVFVGAQIVSMGRAGMWSVPRSRAVRAFKVI